MKTRIVLSFLVSMAFGLVVAGEASAKGACVYLKNDSFQCNDRVSNANACHKKGPGGLGEFHADTTCKRIGHGASWGIATAPQPPAKPSFDRAAFTMKAPADVPSIPSPFQKNTKKGKRF